MSHTDYDAVFKAYDIRGVVPHELHPDFAQRLGLALAHRARALGVKTVVTGCDGRHSSPSLLTALQDGLNAGGVHTLDVGMVPTPLVYFCAHTQCADAAGSGVVVTGSHNPPEYNGFKMMLAGQTLHGASIQQLKDFMQYAPPAGIPRGTRTLLDVKQTYIDRICQDVSLARPLHIAVDCGSGVGGVLAAALFRALGCTVDELYCEVDGNFPHHHPDPADPQNLQDLIAHVRSSDCALGLAFDGDADRLGVVTKSGQIIWPDRQLILYARDVLSRVPGAPILFDVKCSRHVADAVTQAGGRPVMCQTGHSLIKAKLRETGAPLAGEMSGHIFFQERWFGFDDGLYAGARLLEILSRSDDPSAVLQALPQDIATPELKLPMREGEPHALIHRLQCEGRFASARQVHTMDGVRAEYVDGFGLARASNTTPVVVLRFEAQTQAGLARIQQEFRQSLLALAPQLALPF